MNLTLGSSLEGLPLEMLSHIYSFLNRKDKLASRGINWFFYKIITQNLFRSNDTSVQAKLIQRLTRDDSEWVTNHVEPLLIIRSIRVISCSSIDRVYGLYVLAVVKKAKLLPITDDWLKSNLGEMFRGSYYYGTNKTRKKLFINNLIACFPRLTERQISQYFEELCIKYTGNKIEEFHEPLFDNLHIFSEVQISKLFGLAMAKLNHPRFNEDFDLYAPTKHIVYSLIKYLKSDDIGELFSVIKIKFETDNSQNTANYIFVAISNKLQSAQIAEISEILLKKLVQQPQWSGAYLSLSLIISNKNLTEEQIKNFNTLISNMASINVNFICGQNMGNLINVKGVEEENSKSIIRNTITIIDELVIPGIVTNWVTTGYKMIEKISPFLPQDKIDHYLSVLTKKIQEPVPLENSYIFNVLKKIIEMTNNENLMIDLLKFIWDFNPTTYWEKTLPISICIASKLKKNQIEDAIGITIDQIIKDDFFYSKYALYVAITKEHLTSEDKKVIIQHILKLNKPTYKLSEIWALCEMADELTSEQIDRMLDPILCNFRMGSIHISHFLHEYVKILDFLICVSEKLSEDSIVTILKYASFYFDPNLEELTSKVEELFVRLITLGKFYKMQLEELANVNVTVSGMALTSWVANLQLVLNEKETNLQLVLNEKES